LFPSHGQSGNQLLLIGVAVEKLHFRQNCENLGDRKCLGKPRTSFVGHPDAILFLRISRERLFSTATGDSTQKPFAGVNECYGDVSTTTALAHSQLFGFH
jgi:hypothetical protein